MEKANTQNGVVHKINDYKFIGIVADSSCQVVKLEKEGGKIYLGHLYWSEEKKKLEE